VGKPGCTTIRGRVTAHQELGESHNCGHGSAKFVGRDGYEIVATTLVFALLRHVSQQYAHEALFGRDVDGE
jgi:hypothetical protein